MRKGIFQKFKKSCVFLLALAMIVSLITGIGTMEVKGAQVIDEVKVTIDYSKIPDIQVGKTVHDKQTYTEENRENYEAQLEIENCSVRLVDWL